MTSAHSEQIRREQERLDLLYAHRDGELAQVRGQIADADVGGTAAGVDEPGERISRRARIERLQRRRTELERAETGLCFGRITDVDGSRRYIGRIGLRADRAAPGEPESRTTQGADDDADPLLVDWRAPVARKFYTATAARPLGLRARRHIRTDGRAVTGVDDEPLDLPDGTDGELVGEAVLLAALDSRRTGMMGDIVATLQAEQDEIIRAPHHGALVVQGGPGTGKTVVALHRAAYLLFTHQRLAERGVLVVGPSEAFLDYISAVLPSLGETQVVSATPDGLLPGVTATAADPPEAAEVKGRGLWAAVLDRAVRRREPVVGAVTVEVGGERLRLSAAVVSGLLEDARGDAAGRHAARQLFRESALDELARALAAENAAMLADVERGFEDILARVDAGLATDPGVGVRRESSGMAVDGVASDADLAAIRRSLAADTAVDRALDAVWPAQDPRVVLADLLSDPVALAACAPELDDAERAAVLRPAGAVGWSPQDVPLLDEIADLVGAPGTIADVPNSGLRADAHDPLAVRAATDRTWAYGHVIVDEAQELSGMQWRMLLRRCPSRSFTVVGDVNQVEAAAGTDSWDTVLEPVFGPRRRRMDLTVCYRTPHEVMQRTAPVLRAAGSTVEPPKAVRSGGVPPWRRELPAEPGAPTGGSTLVEAVRESVAELAGRYAGGRVAVITSADRVPVLERAVVGGSADGGVAVMDPEGSKGLEFDAALIVDPHGIIDQPRGWNALYVAMTRCTQELGVIAVRPGPAELLW